MKRLSIVLLLAGCAQHKAADPKAAPAPWVAETAPPPARTATPATAPAPPPPATPSPSTASAAVAAVPAPVRGDAPLPDEGRPRPIVLPRPERARLASGAEVLLVRRPRLPIVTLYVVWPVGAADEPQERAGLAYLTADLLSEGAGKRTALEIATEMERLGVRLSTSASWDSTVVAITALTRALPAALDVLGDIVLRPQLADTEIERLRKNTQGRILSSVDQPATQAGLAGARALYGDGHRYGELVMGGAAQLRSLTREQIVEWHRTHLTPAQATIVAVGDVDMKSLKPRLDKIFGPKPLGEATPLRPPRATPPPPKPRVILVDKPGAAQTEMRAYQVGPPRITPDYFPLLVLNTIFGGNFSSRLNAKLREEKGYTYGARSDFAFRRDGGAFSAGAPVKTAVTRAALVDLRAELARLAKGEVDPTELRIAKDTLQRSLARSFETPPEVASALAAIRVYGLPDDYFATYAQKIDAVSPADLKRVATGLGAEMMTLVFVGDEKAIGEDLRKELGPYEKITVRGPAPAK